jgi:hypothetical protein
MSMPVAFFVIVSDDHERAQRFYASLFADPDGTAVGLRA